MSIELIKEKVDKLKLLDFEKAYEFGNPVSETELINFESKFNLTLPEYFRLFISQIANGIKSYGSDICSDIIKRNDFKKYFSRKDLYNPGIEFPLTKKTCGIESFDDIDEINSHKHFYPYETDFILFDKYESRPYTNGWISLMGYGCGTHDFIVVKGKEKGNMWCDNESSNNEMVPLFDKEKNMKRITFEYWINDRLDNQIQKLISHNRRNFITNFTK